MDHNSFQNGFCLPEFKSLCSAQEQCTGALKKALCPDEYQCSRCRSTAYCVLHVRKQKTFPGKISNDQSSLIAGTLFHSPPEGMRPRDQPVQAVQ